MTSSPLFVRFNLKNAVENGVPIYAHCASPEDNSYSQVDSIDLEGETFKTEGYSYFLDWNQVRFHPNRVELGSYAW